VVSLLAGVKYQLSYSVILQNVSAYELYAETRLHVLTGDSSWGLNIDDNNVSRSKYDDAGEMDLYNITFNGTAFIIPASNTTIQLEALTHGGSTHGRAKVVHCSLKVNS